MQRTSLEQYVTMLESRMDMFETSTREAEDTLLRHHALQEEINRRLDLLNTRSKRHRKEIESSCRGVSDIQGRLRRVEDELIESQSKVSWSGGSCRIPANCPTLT